MSATNGIVTGAAVVGVGVAGYLAWQAAQRAQLIKQVKDAGGDDATIQAVLAQWRAGGGTGASSTVAIGGEVNKDAGEQAEEQADSVWLYLSNDGSGGGAGGKPRSLSVVRPKAYDENFLKGQAPWLPGQPGSEMQRQAPIEKVRGFQFGEIAYTYLRDIYPASRDGISVVAYPSRYGYHRQQWWEVGAFGRSTRYRELPRATRDGAEHALDIYVASTFGTAGGAVVLWDRDAQQVETNADRVIWAIADSRPDPRRGVAPVQGQRGFLSTRSQPWLYFGLRDKPLINPLPNRPRSVRG